MSYSLQAFTQSLRLIDPINQERIKQQKRILWPDYEVLTLINSFEQAAQKQDQELDLSTLFMYCAIEEKFLVKKTTRKQYLNLSQCYDPEFTHVAAYLCKKRNHNQQRSQLASENSRSLDNRRKSSVQKMYRPTKIDPQSQELYIILSRRSIAVDEVVRTSHKVCISVVPLSGQKYLWGGSLYYEEFEPTGQGNSKNQQNNSLFKPGGETFGFNIISAPSNFSSSIRKTNGMVDKRSLRFSNYQSSKKQNDQNQNGLNNKKQPKQCTNTIKLTPQHIRQHQQFLYIELDLNNLTQLPSNPSDYNFVSIDIFGRHMKPKYGGKYEDQSSEQSDDEDSLNPAKRFRKFMKEEIFLIYSMPFMVFNSYLESQLNFEDNQDIREISFRGSCQMFSAMKKLELKSENKEGQENQKEKSKYDDVKQKSLQMGKKQKFPSFDDANGENSQTDSSKKFAQKVPVKEGLQGAYQTDRQEFEVIQLIEMGKQKETDSLNSQTKKSMQDLKGKLLKSLCLRLIQNKKESSDFSELIYFPVFNPTSSQPHRLSIPLNLLQIFNPEIQKQTVKVEIQSHRLKDIKDQQQVQIDAPRRQTSRQSMYIGRSTKKQPQTNPQQIKYTNINVFLTDKVYKQEAVELVTSLLEKFQRVTNLDIDTIQNQSQWMKDFDNFVVIRSVQQMRNIMILLDDLNLNNETKYFQIGSMVKLLIWVQMFILMDYLTQSQLDLISSVKKQTQTLLSDTSLTYDERSSRQQNIISLIKDYHQKSTFEEPVKTFFVELFFCFFTDCLNNDGWFFKTLELAFKNQKQFESEMNGIEKVFSKFFMMNCNNMLGTYSSQLELLFERLESSTQEEEDNEKDVEIDKDPSQTVTALDKHQNLSHISLIKLLKASVVYTVQNISQIPINIFLSQPLEKFQDEYQAEDHTQNQDSQQNCNQKTVPFSCDKLKRFIRRYFVRGHNYFLQRETNQGVHDLDTNVRYMNLVADMLKLYIRLGNLQQNLLGGNKKEEVTNVIELVNKEYRSCLDVSQEMRFTKVLGEKDNFGVEYKEITKFKKILPHYKDHKTLLNRLKQIKESNQYSTFNSFFLINLPTQNHHEPNSIFKVSPTFNKQSKTTKSLQIRSTKRSFSLSNNNQSTDKFDFLITLTEKESLDIEIMITPSQFDEAIETDSYEISFLNNQLGLNKSNHGMAGKMLFSFYEVFVEVEILRRNSQEMNKEEGNDVQRIVFQGSKVLVFDNFNTSTISNNMITLSCFEESSVFSNFKLCSIQKVGIKLYSRQLPILQHSLSFINLRLNKYLKNLLFPLNSNKKSTSSSRKTIGGRFTEHLSKRNDVLGIEDNMGIGRRKYGKGNNSHEPKKTTLFDLPEELIYHLLNADKCYVQEQEKLLKFVDQYYEQNQPIYSDYILYLAIRPSFLRLSTVIKHLFANRTKYQDSEILQSFIKLKMSSPQFYNEQSLIAKIFTTIPRISSIKPLKNVKDTLEERDLLVKYVKESSKRQSLEKDINSGLFRKKNTVELINQKKKEAEKDVEI